jgi:hypothetical protein
MSETKIVIEDVHVGYDGEYDVDLSYFTNRDLHTIKRLTGLRVGELDEAMRTGDSDVLVAFCVIALQRHGKPVDEDVLWDAQAGSITIVVGEEEPVPSIALLPNETFTTSSATSSISGGGSTNGSEDPGNDPNPIGTLESVTHAV